MDLANQPNVADDPIRALRRLPGVVQGGLSAASNLRGGETSEVLVLLDGFPLRQPFHLPGYQSPFSLLEEDLIASIDVFTGGFPARYGNRLAGVFDIESAEAGQAPKTAIGISFINAHARTAGESDDGTSSWRASARQGTLRPVLQYLSVDAGRPSYSDLSLTGTHRPRADLQLSGNVLWATDEYALNDDDERAEISSRTRYSWLSAEYTPSEISRETCGSVTAASKSIAWAMSTNQSSQSAMCPIIATPTCGTRAPSELALERSQPAQHGVRVDAGSADYSYDSVVTFPDALAELFDREPGFERSLRAAPTQHRFAVFASQRWKLGERWMPEIGLRMQEIHVGAIRERTWDPRIGIRWEVEPAHRIACPLGAIPPGR